MKSGPTPKLTPKQRALLNDLCEAAMSWGWHQDQGTGRVVDTAEKDFNEAREAMAKYLATVRAKRP